MKNKTRKIEFRDKIFKLKDVQNIAFLIWKEYESFSNDETKTAVIRFEVNCAGQVSHGDEDLKIFNEDSMINFKLLESIDMEFIGINEKYIRVRIDKNYTDIRGNTPLIRPNDIEVRGNDTMWVDGLIAKFTDVLDSVEDQNSWWRRWQSLILLGFFIASIGVIGYMADFKNSHLEKFISFWTFNKDIYARITVAGIISILPLGFFYLFYNSKVYTAFPLIELQIGPEHKYKAKKIRNFYITLFSLIIIPVLLSLILSKI
jgi:hypothetical protein